MSDALIYIAVLYTYNPYIASHYNKQLEQSTNKMEDMYKQAILDAKAVRASAMANAKATLQEAFEPKIQEMIRLKLSEELEGEGEMEEFDEIKGHEEEMDEAKKEEEMDEASLEEILAELEELSQTDEADMSYTFDESDFDEAKEETDEYADELEEAEKEEGEGKEESEEESEEENGEEGEAPVEDDTKVIDITLGDLKQVLQSVMGNQEPEAEEAGAEEGEEAGEEKSTDVDLDEILAELDKMKKEEGKKSEEMDEKKEEDETKKQLAEANKTINVLRHDLNEVNLLNAKLLYMNKIFKSKNLSESQKVNVVSALDRASNTKEAKNIYETLKETLSTRKSQISESKGFASNPAGVAPKKTIVEADTFVSRWQKIAGIK